MATMFAGPDDFSPTNINALRGQRAWSMMKLAMVEVLMLYQEAVALDAFIGATFTNLQYTCDEIYRLHFNLGRLVTDLREKLTNTREMLRQYRTNKLVFVTETKRCRVCTADGCHSYDCGTINVGVRDTIRDIQFKAREGSGKLKRSWNHELQFDILHLSYPMEKELEFFETYEANTMKLCEVMMSNSTLRDVFAAAF